MRRLPIVIGHFEAQAIMRVLDKMKSARPFTHDLFYNLMTSFKLELHEVLIHRFDKGIFYAKLCCRLGDQTLEIDSRTSDALALAVRAGCPIYTYEHILETAGLIMDESSGEETPSSATGKEKTSSYTHLEEASVENLSNKSLEELEQMLQDVLAREDYMKAVSIRDEIRRRKG